MTAFVARALQSRTNLKHSYRVVFVPETIGAIAYCKMNEEVMRNIEMGLVVTTVGGLGNLENK